jgi:hypothetical protein
VAVYDRRRRVPSYKGAKAAKAARQSHRVTSVEGENPAMISQGSVGEGSPRHVRFRTVQGLRGSRRMAAASVKNPFPTPER